MTLAAEIVDPIKPIGRWFSITPSDTQTLPTAVRALWIGIAGDVRLGNADGDDEVFRSVPTGYLVATPTRIYAGGTTASQILGLY